MLINHGTRCHRVEYDTTIGINKLQLHPATWMTLTSILFNERGQTHKNAQRTVPLKHVSKVQNEARLLYGVRSPENGCP